MEEEIFTRQIIEERVLPLIGALSFVILGLFVFIAVPFAQIWAINTLFKTQIEYNITNWFAIIIISTIWMKTPSFKN